MTSGAAQRMKELNALSRHDTARGRVLARGRSPRMQKIHHEVGRHSEGVREEVMRQKERAGARSCSGAKQLTLRFTITSRSADERGPNTDSSGDAANKPGGHNNGGGANKQRGDSNGGGPNKPDDANSDRHANGDASRPARRRYLWFSRQAWPTQAQPGRMAQPRPRMRPQRAPKEVSSLEFLLPD